MLKENKVKTDNNTVKLIKFNLKKISNLKDKRSFLYLEWRLLYFQRNLEWRLLPLPWDTSNVLNSIS